MMHSRTNTFPRLGRMACALLLALAVGAPAAGAAGPARAGSAHAHAAASCRLPGGRTIASGRTARLIAIPTPEGRALFACIRRSGRKVPLDDSFSDARLNGRWVAWQRPARRGQWRIAVHDLRNGRERLVNGHVAAQSLRLSARGSIVWAQDNSPTPGTPLYANEATTGGRLLDAGAVDPKSVRLAGRLVSWLSGGARRTALVR